MNEIKKIIAVFLDVSEENISPNTVINNSAVQGSVKIHMMYGDLADNGYVVKDYSNIKTFGDLLHVLNLSNDKNNEKINQNKESNSQIDNKYSANPQKNDIGLGVDIISVSKLPIVDDFRESSFYKDNFSLREFSYCLLKPNPYKSFAGKFAAKEALIKADNRLKTKSFNEIEILNSTDGKPYFENYSISISYEDDYAIAIATSAATKNSNVSHKNFPIENQKENYSNLKKEILAELNNNMNENHANKSSKKIIAFLIFLNLIIIAYLIYRDYTLLK